MFKLTLILFSALSLATSSALASSYQQIDGTIVDPIQCWSGCVGDHPVSGYILRPGTIGYRLVASAPLSGMDLRLANLSTNVLLDVDLSGANLSGADLTDLILGFSDVTGTDLTGANLTNSQIMNDSTGSPFYNIYTDFTGAVYTDTSLNVLGPFDPVAAGWTLVPEPSTALLMGLGLTALAVRRGE